MPSSKQQNQGKPWALILSLWLVVACRAICFSDSEVGLIEPPHQSLDSDTIHWDVPLASDGVLSSLWVRTEFVSAGLAVGLSLMILVLHMQLPNAGVLLIMLCVLLPLEHTVAALLLLLGTLGKSVGVRFVMRVCAVSATICCSLEFGFVCGALLAFDAMQLKSKQRGAAFCSMITTVLAVVGCSFFLDGFAVAAQRPFSVWSYRVPDVMPQLMSMIYHGDWVAISAIAGIGGLALVGSKSVPVLQWTLIFLLLIVGIVCRFYAGLALTAIVALSFCDSTSLEKKRLPFWVGPSVAAVFCMAILVQEGVAGRWTASQPPVRFEETQSRHLLLADLSSSRRWKTSGTWKLILDDRWELVGERYADYAATINDLSLGRQEVYQRANGKWGGYRSFVAETSPALFVVPSSRASTIRRIVMDPDWNVSGIDGRETCFSHADFGTSFRAQRLLSQVMSVEWPNARSTYSLDGLINFETDPAMVAGVLVAMRFPNAALRILEQSSSEPPRNVIDDCWLEIANRYMRQTGRIPVAVMAVVHGRLLNPSIEATHRDELLNVLRKSPLLASPQTSEANVRKLIALGEIEEAKQLLVGIRPSDEKSFLGIVASADTAAIGDFALSLEGAAEGFDDPKVRAEALASVGTLYLANGRPERALSAFLASRSAVSDCYLSVYRELNIRGLFGMQ